MEAIKHEKQGKVGEKGHKMNRITITSGKKRITSKERAIELVVDFGMDEEARLIQEGKRGAAKRIRQARKSMCYSLMQHGIKGLRETLYYMTETFPSPAGRYEGQETWDIMYYIRDEYTRDLVRDFRLQYFSE